MVHLKYVQTKLDVILGFIFVLLGILYTVQVFLLFKTFSLWFLLLPMLLLIPIEFKYAYHFINLKNIPYLSFSNRKMYINKVSVFKPKGYDASEMKVLLKTKDKIGVGLSSGKVVNVQLNLLSESDRELMMTKLNDMLDMTQLS